METEKTLVHQLHHHAQTIPDSPALFDYIDGTWQALTWSEFAKQSVDLASGLLTLGVKAGDTVTIMGPNRRDWLVAQLGAWSIGVKISPIYATSADLQVAYIIEHSEAKVAIAMDNDALEKLQRVNNKHNLGLTLISADPSGKDTHSLETVQKAGLAQGEEAVHAAIAQINKDTINLLIYTSGTTGYPKGVQLDHGNMLSVAESVVDYSEFINNHGYILLSYLPLSHIAEQTISVIYPLKVGGQVYFCQDMTKVKDLLPLVRPTVFVGVPRVWEKFQAALESAVSSASYIKQSLFTWAQRIELQAQTQQLQGSPERRSFARAAARRLVIHPLHRRLGFDRLHLAAAGGAPTYLDTLQFFASIGILIHEGYGMTETTGPAITNPYKKVRLGTVGQVIRGAEVQIADDGEVLTRGRSMTRGYFKSEDATNALIDPEGWLHTGDIGTLDADGYLKITGRKKELLITSGGKNVSPNEIEALLNTIEGVSQSVVVGDREPYLIGLFTLDQEAIPRIRQRLSLNTSSPDDIVQAPEFIRHLNSEVDKINTQLARYQTIKKFHIIAHEFSIDGGELTPSLKLRRAKIVEKYADPIKSLYNQVVSQF